ncbi:MAG: hypothetical protein L0Y32_00030, partial [Nevskiales bacterium]|nr:hypothetical protein [Nevskiales bacterium]
MSFVSAPGYGTGWTVEPMASMSYETNDNRTLSTTAEASVYGFTLDTGATAAMLTELATTRLTPRLVATRYSGGDQYDTEDLYLSGYSQWLGERDRWVLAADVARNSTLTTQESDVGLLDQRVERLGWSVAPSWERRLTERGTLDLAASQKAVDYDDASGGLIDS